METTNPIVSDDPAGVASSRAGSLVVTQPEVTTRRIPSGEMPSELSLLHVDATTPLGANVLASGEGAIFRVWAPAAREVRLLWDYFKLPSGEWRNTHESKLQPMEDGFWGGFVPELRAGERYMFYVVGPVGGTEGLKRDPYARELTQDPAWPDCQCLLVNPAEFPWHDDGFIPPTLDQLSIYQLHVGVWYIPEGRTNGTFLDVVEKLPYLKALGVTAIQPLPIVEFPTMFSMGYNGVDYYSPETDFGVKDSDPALARYLDSINRRLLAIDPQARTYTLNNLHGTANQLKVMIDLCHLHGIAVLLDVVFNHAGGDFGDRSIYFFDQKRRGNQNDSLYFTDQDWAGGLVFAYWNENVRQFLIDDARYYLREMHCDGFRYDEVSVIKNLGGEPGWRLCTEITDTCHAEKPAALHVAECWPVEQAIVTPTRQGGAGFDATLNDGLREAVRGALRQAAAGAGAFVDMDRIGRELASPRLIDCRRAVQCTEYHDRMYVGNDPRIPRLADGSDARSWYARSRSRVALGLTLTAAGVPHVFMGQEFLEDKPWSDNPAAPNRIWWTGAETDPSMIDFLRFARELLALRNRLKGLRGSGINVYHVHNANRVLAFQRWVPGQGGDVVVVASLCESTYSNYQIGFPTAGHWTEVFNGDAYDHWVNPWVAGNRGGIEVTGPGMHGLPFSASITIPANGLVVFAR